MKVINERENDLDELDKYLLYIGSGVGEPSDWRHREVGNWELSLSLLPTSLTIFLFVTFFDQIEIK